MTKKKKIGIITLHQITNYGGILQAYALQKVIANMGYEVEHIEKSMYPKRLSTLQKIFLYPLRYFRKKILHQKLAIRAEENRYKWVDSWYATAKYTMSFIKKNIIHKYVHSFKELVPSDYDALVVGSDQIWRPKYTADVGLDIEDAFLSFAHNWNVKRIAYAVSFGSENWEYSETQTKNCKDLLALFNAVSCREEKGLEFCETYLNYKNATKVLDPTLLLDKEEYMSLGGDYKDTISGNLMCYVLDENQTSNSIISYMESKEGLSAFSVKAVRDFYMDVPIKDRLQPHVEKWLKGFQTAKFVVTDSFHACVFSIIFRKPFVVITNPDRGVARYKTLLSYLDLEYRMVNDYDEQLLEDILRRPIVIDEEKLSILKEVSLNFLRNNLL